MSNEDNKKKLESINHSINQNILKIKELEVKLTELVGHTNKLTGKKELLEEIMEKEEKECGQPNIVTC